MIEELDIAEILKLGSGLIALILLFISLLAYRRIKQKRILFVSAAFALYVIKIIAEHVEIFSPNLDTSLLDLLLSFIDFAILLLFFLAVVRNEKEEHG
jgi:hypothetical protein